MSVSVQAHIGLEGYASKTVGTDIATDPIRESVLHIFDNGTGANQANKLWTVSGTISAGSFVTYDFIGGLLEDAFGDSVALTRIKAFYFYNTHATQAIAFESTIPGILGGGGFQPVGPGGVVFVSRPDSTGIAITSGSDTITISNSGGAATGTYDIVVVGTQ